MILLAVLFGFFLNVPFVLGEPPAIENLIFYAPLNGDHELADQVNKVSPIYSKAILSPKNGPFWLPSTSYSPLSAFAAISTYEKLPKLNDTLTKGDWTVSFFFRTSFGNVFYPEKGLLQSWSSPTEFLSFTQFGTSLFLWTSKDGDKSAKLIAAFDTVIVDETWNFIAITHSGDDFKLFDSFGMLKRKGKLYADQKAPLKAGSYLDIGEGREQSKVLNLARNDQMACVAIYSKVLTQHEIFQFFESCKLSYETQPQPPAYLSDFTMKTWPHPEKLQLYLPMTEIHGFYDVSGHQISPRGVYDYETRFSSDSNSWKNDEPEWSFLLRKSAGQLVDYHLPHVVKSQDSTVTFYLHYSGYSKEDGLFSFTDEVGHSLTVSRTGTINGDQVLQIDFTNGATGFSFQTPSDFNFKANQWIYLAITIQKNSITIFNNFKQSANITFLSDISFANSFLSIGRGYWPDDKDQPWVMQPADRLACFSIHKQVLTEEEIQKMAKSCSEQQRQCYSFPEQSDSKFPNSPSTRPGNFANSVVCQRDAVCAKVAIRQVSNNFQKYSWRCANYLATEQLACGRSIDDYLEDGSSRRTCTCCSSYCNDQALDGWCSTNLPAPKTPNSATRLQISKTLALTIVIYMNIMN